jgi:hypothetical protein
LHARASGDVSWSEAPGTGSVDGRR